MGAIRLQKYIADCGICSRRKAEELILEGKVRVNGTVVDEMGAKITPGVDRVTVGRKPALMPVSGVMILHKPRGVVSTLHDPAGRKTVADYLTKKQASYYPVGRLDYDSSGLVILTNDGALAHRLMHPKFGMPRVYKVQVAGEMTEKTLRRINRGVRLKDGMVYADAIIVKSGRECTHLKITLTEGRNRIIRRLMDHLRHPVEKLHRISHGPFKLGALKGGNIRVYSEEDYRRLRKKVMDQPKAEPAGKKTSTGKSPKKSSTRAGAKKARSGRNAQSSKSSSKRKRKR